VVIGIGGSGGDYPRLIISTNLALSSYVSVRRKKRFILFLENCRIKCIISQCLFFQSLIQSLFDSLLEYENLSGGFKNSIRRIFFKIVGVLYKRSV